MDATSRRSSEATFNGADGVVWSRNSWTTPPRLHELMRLRDFFDRAATPPPAEEGSSVKKDPKTTIAWNPHPVLVCAQTTFAIWAHVLREKVSRKGRVRD